MKLYGTMEVDDEGVLEIGGNKAPELAEEFGTPLLVLDEQEIRDNLRNYLQNLESNYDKYSVAYAAKAFMNRTLARIIDDEGGSLDVVSGGELQMALAADFPPEKVYFHGNNKSLAELKMGLEHNVGRFMIDNALEAERLNELALEAGQKARVILRITPGIEAHTHEFIQTGQLDSKFGVGLAHGQALEMIKKLQEYRGLRLMGLHAHIGSQIFDIRPYQRLIEIIFKFLQEIRQKLGLVLSEIDLGGGLGIAHLEEETDPDPGEFIRAITDTLKQESKHYDYPRPEVILEPGRSIIGPAGTTLYTVGTIKQVPGLSKYLIVDGGMTDNIRPALYDADYEAMLVSRGDQLPQESVTIAGKCCESGDILIKDIQLPAAEVGNILAIPATGAYTYAMSSNYNGLPRPAVVLVKEGQAYQVIERESYQDIYKNDVIPEGY